MGKMLEVPVYWYPDLEGDPKRDIVIDKEGMIEKLEQMIEEMIEEMVSES